MSQSSAGLSAKGKANRGHGMGQGNRLPVPNANDGREALPEDTPRTALVSAAEATRVDAKED